MATITFADVVHQSITFSDEVPSERIVLELIDSPWIQRLRDVSQTANTRLVYMFSEHSRFGHCLGVAYLANRLMAKLAERFPEEIERYRVAVSAAAILHDIGHLAPGSHTAFKTWFPEQLDSHEEIAIQIIREDDTIQSILSHYGDTITDTICEILNESSELPPWTWQIISGGGWNVDRGNWCMVDSILAGVSYGEYNIPAITDSIVLTDDANLALRENRLDAMMHFAVSRHAMYRQLYQHRVLLSADTINRAIAQRARDIGDTLPFADEAMQEVLAAKSPSDLSLSTIFAMRESWWRYHVARWHSGDDPILAELCDRLLNRRLFKTVRLKRIDDREELIRTARDAVAQAGYDPTYYFHIASTIDVHAGDQQQSMPVLMDDGRVRALTEVEPLFNALVNETKDFRKTWLVMPAEAKPILGRSR